MLMYKKNKKVVENLDFLTPYEKNLAEKHKKIFDRYKELMDKYESTLSKSRIFNKIAEEFSMTQNGVRQLIYRSYDIDRTKSAK